MAQTWDNNATNQQTFINNVDAKFATLRQYAEPQTVYSQAEPTALSSALYQELQWLDPSTNVLKNAYTRVQDLAGGGTSQKLLPITPFPASPVPYTLLDWISTGDSAGAATQTFNNINQNFQHLLVYLVFRSTAAAATSTLTIRPNGTATANYGYSYQASNTGGPGAGGTEQTGQTGIVLTVPAATSWRGYYAEGFLQIFDYVSSSAPTRMFYRGAYMSGALPVHPAAATLHNNQYGLGVLTSLAAVTSLSFVTGTGVSAGSRIVLFGI